MSKRTWRYFTSLEELLALVPFLMREGYIIRSFTRCEDGRIEFEVTKG